MMETASIGHSAEQNLLNIYRLSRQPLTKMFDAFVKTLDDSKDIVIGSIEAAEPATA
jgi:hypothetical protein